MSGLNDLTDLNDATGLERLSSEGNSTSQRGSPDKDLDSSASQSNDTPQAQLERLSQ